VTSVSQERWLRVSERSLRNTAPQNGFVIDHGPEFIGRALDEGGAKAPLDRLHPAPSVPDRHLFSYCRCLRGQPHCPPPPMKTGQPDDRHRRRPGIDFLGDHSYRYS